MQSISQFDAIIVKSREFTVPSPFGEGANGKTVFTKIIEKMVGEENVSHLIASKYALMCLELYRKSN